MAIAYPLALPAVKTPMRVVFRARDSVGQATSPFTGAQETYAFSGQWWEADLELPPMKRANAEAWIAFLLSLKGRHGSFTLGDPLGATARGDASGTPLVNGGSQTGGSLVLDGAGASKSPWLAAGDWIQLSSGASRRLHKVLADAASDGSGNVTLDIWPDLRESPADNDPVVVASALGRWMLASNTREWSLEKAQMYGLRFSCVEDLRPL